MRCGYGHVLCNESCGLIGLRVCVKSFHSHRVTSLGLMVVICESAKHASKEIPNLQSSLQAKEDQLLHETISHQMKTPMLALVRMGVYLSKMTNPQVALRKKEEGIA